MAKTILVVEDEIALREAVVMKLKKAGYDVIEASSGEHALEVLKDRKPDLIWSDLLMPGMGGFVMLEHIRKDQNLKDIPVMIVSVSASPEKIQRAFQLNIVDYVVKSQYTLEDIAAKVARFLAPEQFASKQ